MRRLGSVTRVGGAALVSALAALTSACGSSNSVPTWDVSTTQHTGFASNVTQRAWMLPNVANADLLYVSDGNGEVSVYRYWQRSLAGILTNFTQPMGMCVNATGDIYIADYGAQKVYEYAHGGTKAIATFDETPLRPYACAVNLATGDLAVANVATSSSAQGDVAIYAHGSGTTPTIYTDSNLGDFEGCAYDSSGELLVTNGDAPDSNGPASFAWLPKNGSKLLDINIPGREPSWTWYDVTGIQWDGKYFVIDLFGALNRVSLLKGLAYYVGETGVYEEPSGPYWIYNNNPKEQGTQMVAASGSRSSGEVYYWYYPKGGGAIHYLSHGLDDPFAVTVSLKKKD